MAWWWRSSLPLPPFPFPVNCSVPERRWEIPRPSAHPALPLSHQIPFVSLVRVERERMDYHQSSPSAPGDQVATLTSVYDAVAESARHLVYQQQVGGSVQGVGGVGVDPSAAYYYAQPPPPEMWPTQFSQLPCAFQPTNMLPHSIHSRNLLYNNQTIPQCSMGKYARLCLLSDLCLNHKSCFVSDTFFTIPALLIYGCFKFLHVILWSLSCFGCP